MALPKSRFLGRPPSAVGATQVSPARRFLAGWVPSHKYPERRRCGTPILETFTNTPDVNRGITNSNSCIRLAHPTPLPPPAHRIYQAPALCEVPGWRKPETDSAPAQPRACIATTSSVPSSFCSLPHQPSCNDSCAILPGECAAREHRSGEEYGPAKAPFDDPSNE